MDNLEFCENSLILAKEDLLYARKYAPQGRVFYRIAEAQIIVENALLLLERLRVKDKMALMKISELCSGACKNEDCN